MKIYLGADHGGFAVKEELKLQLTAKGYEVTDCGAAEFQPDDDYPMYGRKVAESVAADPGSLGVALCRSGHGMVMAANKIPGVRAALATTPEWTNQSKTHDDANVLAVGVDFTDTQQVLPLVMGWIDSVFEGGRHQQRIDQLADIERSQA